MRGDRGRRPEVEPVLSGTAGVLTVETSINAVSAVSYGGDEPVGSIASDREMDPEGAVDGSVVEASSEFSDSFRTALAIDGDIGTEWSSRGDGDNAFIALELGSETDVSAVAFRTREMSDGTAITSSFTVTVDDVETFGPYPAGCEPVDVRFREQVLDAAESTGGNRGAVEIEVYRDPARGEP